MNQRALPVTMTEAAAERVKALLAKRPNPAAGVRIGVKPSGCSGMSYTLEYVDEKGAHDDVIEAHGVTVFVDPKATMFIFGTEIDWVEDKMKAGFVFRNPNETGRCGCGESFSV